MNYNKVISESNPKVFITPMLIEKNVVKNEVVINPLIKKMMKNILNNTMNESEILDSYFVKEAIPPLNRNCRQCNYYIFDRYGLIIRRAHFNDPRKAYGWTKDDNGEPVCIHIDKSLIDVNAPNIRELTLSTLKTKFKAEFGEKGVYGRVSKQMNIKF